jgi:hypothetical protein
MDYYYRGIAYQDDQQSSEAIHDLEYFIQRANAQNAGQKEMDDARDSLAELHND